MYGSSRGLDPFEAEMFLKSGPPVNIILYIFAHYTNLQI